MRADCRITHTKTKSTTTINVMYLNEGYKILNSYVDHEARDNGHSIYNTAE